MGNNLVAFIVLIIYFIGLFVLAAIANDTMMTKFMKIWPTALMMPVELP